MISDKQFSESIATWRAVEDLPPEMIANAASATWSNISLALSPVIGSRGVAALIKRSIHLARIEYPDLNVIDEGVILDCEVATLHDALAKLTSADAITFNSAILNTFHKLLSKLIGDALAQKLLISVVDTPSGDDPAQDILS